MHAPASLLVLTIVVASSTANLSITFPETSDPVNALVPHPTGGQTAPLKEIAHHVANLGLKTLRDLFTGLANVVISPLNVYSCLAILNLGAAGKTKEELCSVLGPLGENHALAEMVKPAEGVSFASALFLDRSFVPKSAFVDAAMAEFRASVKNVNVSDGERAKQSINSWVSEHTNGTIVDLLQGHLDPETKMVVVSALLFKGKWLHSFPTAATASGKFETDGGSVDVPLMHLVASVPLVRNPHFDAISLPYIHSHGMTMHVILPRAHGAAAIKQLLSHINSYSLRKLRREASTEEIFIIIPKMHVVGRSSLTNPLKKQGISAMFNPSKANFTGCAENSSGLFVSQIHHSLHFEMDEEGTAASAATASILTKSSRFIFRVIRPFIFVVTDDSDFVLFMGAIVNPLS